METDPMQTGTIDRRVVFRLTNRGSSPILVRIEPWAREVDLPVAGTHEFVLTGPDPADIEVEVAPAEVTVYGWTGSVLDGIGLPVPPTPPRSE
jgi:hypothetical protein